MEEGSSFRTRRAKVCITVSDNKMIALLSEERNHPINGEFEWKEPVVINIPGLMLHLHV
jgi:hypothetical protein